MKKMITAFLMIHLSITVSAQNICVQTGLLTFERVQPLFSGMIKIQQTPLHRGVYLIQLSMKPDQRISKVFRTCLDSMMVSISSPASHSPDILPTRSAVFLADKIGFILLPGTPQAGDEIRLVGRDQGLQNLPDMKYAVVCDTSFYKQPAPITSQDISDETAPLPLVRDTLYLGVISDANDGLVFQKYHTYYLETFDEQRKRLVFPGSSVNETVQANLNSYDNPYMKVDFSGTNPDTAIFVLTAAHARVRLRADEAEEQITIRPEFMVPKLVAAGSFGSAGYDLHQFTHPFGIACTEDRIYVVDSDNYCIKEMDTRGRVLGRIGSHMDLGGQLVKPIDVVAADGRLYVSDRAMNRIVVYGQNGRKIQILCENKVQNPTYMARFNNRLYVAEEGGRIKIVNPQTGLVDRSLPVSVSPDHGGFTIYRNHLYVCQPGGVEIFNLQGRKLRSVPVRMPVTVAVLEEYMIIALINGGLTVYDPMGRRILSLTHVSGEVLDNVRGLALSGRTLWMTDYYSNRVHKVKFGW